MASGSERAGRKRRRKDVAAVPAEGAQIQKPKKKRRRAGASVGADVSAEEQQRRNQQRKLRALALQQRAAGREYRPPFKKRKLDQADQAQKVPRNRLQQQQQQQQQKPAEQGSKPSGAVQVIVIPIFWNKRAEEKEGVLAVAEEVNVLLTEAGISSGVDSTTTLSPGQKFRSYEERKVKLRVEIGPADVQQGTCVLATAAAVPGELASKVKYKRGKPLLTAVQRGLDLPVADKVHKSTPATAADLAERPPARAASVSETKSGKAAAAQVGAEAGVQPASKGRPPAKAVPVRAPKAIHKSGDDLEGDFVGVLEAEEASAAESGKKKRKPKKHLL